MSVRVEAARVRLRLGWNAWKPQQRGDTPPFQEQHVVMTFRQFQPGTTEYKDALRLCEDILRKPLALSLTDADHARDEECFHLGGFDGLPMIAVLLLQPVDGQTLQMRQVAVLPVLQGTGVGSQLIALAEGFARQHGFRRMIAHARGTALGFYLRIGYTAVGEEFLEQTIPHRLVTKTL